MAYKEGSRWTAQYYNSGLSGKKKQVKKRGFLTKRDALDYERQQKLKKSGVFDMKLKTFVEQYFDDKEAELKERTLKNKKYMMEQHIIPYFGDMKMVDITPAHIIDWQKEMYKRNYSDSYLRMIQNQLTALFTHATRIYDMDNNPIKKVKRMGKGDIRSINFWTLDEYEEFIKTIAVDDKYYIMFEILFWTGCREGEMLALTKSDFDFYKKEMNINKTYFRASGEDIITTPKTEESIRVVGLPQFLADEIKQYVDRLYGISADERLFPVVAEAVQHKMKRNIEKAGVKRIRVHDLRHSHVAYLIEQGVEPLVIKERLGHKDIRITLNTYGHLYPSKQRQVVDLLDARNKKKY